MPRSEAQRKMLEADRERARIAYRGLDRCKTEGQEIATIKLNVATPEYRAADRRFLHWSKKVGSNTPSTLQRMFG